MTRILRYIIFAVLSLPTVMMMTVSPAVCFEAGAHDVAQAAISDLSLSIDDGESGQLRYTLLPADLDVASESELVITPVLMAADSTATYRFPAAVVAGRNHVMRYRRGQRVLSEGTILLAGKDRNPSVCVESFPNVGWMAHSILYLDVEKQGCCGKPVERRSIPVAEVDLSRPVFSVPQTFKLKGEVKADPKIIELKGSAYIDFRVNRTEIDPVYRHNISELRKITETIDVARDNPDATITEIRIKGYASPEGSYANNIRLAKGRTASLKDYIKERYGYDESLFKTDFEPEDWAGLRDSVVSLPLPGSVGMLRIIDSDLEPDAKDSALKREYPIDYAYLLENVYPALRHSDYVVTYKIRQFTTPEDVRKALREHPENVSEKELLMLLGSCEPESDEFDNVVAQGVKFFPGNGDLQYLYGVNLARKGDMQRAKEYLQRSSEAGISEAAEALKSIEEVINPKPSVRYVTAE